MVCGGWPKWRWVTHLGKCRVQNANTTIKSLVHDLYVTLTSSYHPTSSTVSRVSQSPMLDWGTPQVKMAVPHAQYAFTYKVWPMLDPYRNEAASGSMFIQSSTSAAWSFSNTWISTQKGSISNEYPKLFITTHHSTKWTILITKYPPDSKYQWQYSYVHRCWLHNGCCDYTYCRGW